MIQNKSPLRYCGGKTRATKIIEEELLKHTDITKYTEIVSPFCGGASFEFHMQNKYNLKIKANDKFTPLYSFWNKLKNNKIELVTDIKKLKPVSKEQFIKYRETIMTADEMTQAALYFVINRSSFSGATLSGGFSAESALKRFTVNSIQLLEKIDLSNTIFNNIDCIDFIEKNTTKTSLLFLDPPYYLENSKLYGKNGDMHENFDHLILNKCLDKQNNWILCYNDCEYIRKLYKKYKIIEVNWNYGMNKTKKSSEILIVNFS